MFLFSDQAPDIYFHHDLKWFHMGRANDKFRLSPGDYIKFWERSKKI